MVLTPTRVCAIFGATAIAGRILGLDAKQMGDALALAFNKAGGSMQSNIDGSLAVRVIQGFTSQSGIICAQLAQSGITGPKNFLEGIYGYFHLYAKDNHDTQAVTGALGRRFEMEKTLFKRYPSCGGTLAPTDAILSLVSEKKFTAEEVARVDVRVSPHVYKLVGGPFEVGENPKVNAQFNIRYCVANGLLRKSSRLRHFDEAEIMGPGDHGACQAYPCLSGAGPRRSRKRQVLYCRPRAGYEKKWGGVRHQIGRHSPGHPGNPLTRDEHLERFHDCVDYAEQTRCRRGPIERIVAMVDRLEEIEDVLSLVPLLLKKRKRG